MKRTVNNLQFISLRYDMIYCILLYRIYSAVRIYYYSVVKFKLFFKIYFRDLTTIVYIISGYCICFIVILCNNIFIFFAFVPNNNVQSLVLAIANAVYCLSLLRGVV